MAHRVFKVAGHSVSAVVHLVTLVVALAAAIYFHIGAPPLRRAVAARVSAIVSGSIQGRLAVDSIGGLGFGGVDGVNARVFDPDGKLVAAAYGVHVRIRLEELVRSLVSNKGPLDVHLTEVSVAALDVDVTVDDKGEIGAQRAFAPKTASPAGRGLTLAVDKAEVGHVWAHGEPAKGFALDADVDAIHAQASITPNEIAVDVPSLSLKTRGMPQRADLQGTLEAHAVLPAPSGAPYQVKAAWKGQVAGLAEDVTASIDGQTVHAVLDAPDISTVGIRALWPASALEGLVTAHAEVKGTFPKLDVSVRATHGAATFETSGPVVVRAGKPRSCTSTQRTSTRTASSRRRRPRRSGVSGDLTLARAADGTMNAKTTVEFGGGRVAGALVPKGKIKASFVQDAKGMRADATVSADEPGAPTSFQLHLAPQGQVVRGRLRQRHSGARARRHPAPRPRGSRQDGPAHQGRRQSRTRASST